MLDQIKPSAGTLAPVKTVAPQNQPPIQTVIPRAEVDASYTAATVEIRTKNPHMDADWDRVWEELGYKGSLAFARERSAKYQREGMEATSQYARDGDRTMRIHEEKGNVFGKIAFQKYTERMKTEVELEALPKFGVKIDVRIFPPEIEVTTKGVNKSS